MHYVSVQFFVEQLLELSHAFEADLQSVVVLAIVGQMEIEARIRPHLEGSGAIPSDAMIGRQPRTSISNIAEISGIPRETVRRKLEGLAQHGWVERDARGLWHIRLDSSAEAPVRRELIDIDRRQMERSLPISRTDARDGDRSANAQGH